MSATLYREGFELDELLAELDDEHPNGVRVVDVTYGRDGGVLGFFARRTVGVHYTLGSDHSTAADAVTDPPPPAMPVATAPVAAAPVLTAPVLTAPVLTAPVPSAQPADGPLEAMLRAAEAAEMVRSGQVPPAPLAPPATPPAGGDVSAENVEFARMLLEMAAQKAAERATTPSLAPQARTQQSRTKQSWTPQTHTPQPATPKIAPQTPQVAITHPLARPPVPVFDGIPVGAPASPTMTATAPIFAPPVVATAPVATAPVATAPVATAPVATAPVATAPVATAPVATAPVATAPAELAAAVSPPVATPEPAASRPRPRPVAAAAAAGTDWSATTRFPSTAVSSQDFTTTINAARTPAQPVSATRPVAATTARFAVAGETVSAATSRAAMSPAAMSPAAMSGSRTSTAPRIATAAKALAGAAPARVPGVATERAETLEAVRTRPIGAHRASADIAATKAAHRHSERKEDATATASAPTATPHTSYTLRRDLVEIGVPVGWIPAGATNPFLVAQELTGQLQIAEDFDPEPGEILVVVGPAVHAQAEAARLCGRLRIDPTSVHTAGCGDTALTHRRQAASLAAQVRTELTPACVIVIATDSTAPAGDLTGRHDLEWAADVVAAVEPDHMLLVVDATSKPADTRAVVGAFDSVSALAVVYAGLTSSPAALWDLNLPVASIDGRPATRGQWAALVIDRLADLAATAC